MTSFELFVTIAGMPPQRCTARLEDKLQHNSKFTQYMFELVEPHTVPFLAGQYVSMKVSDQGLRRSYSISSSPGITHGFELLLDITPQGVGTKYLESLKFGDTVEILMPMGMFTIAEDPTEKHLVFIATGSGVAPFYSMIQDLLQEKHDPRPITLFWGLRYAEDLFWEDEFSRLSEAFPQFVFHPVLSKAVDEWPLCRGRVTDCLSVHTLPENAGYYLCGNAPMIADVSALLTQKGITKEHIHHEKFY